MVTQPARVRGREPTGASCPSYNLAREVAALSLVTRIARPPCADPAGESASCPFPSRPAPAIRQPRSRGTDHEPTQASRCPGQLVRAPGPVEAGTEAAGAAVAPAGPQSECGRHRCPLRHAHG